MQNRGVDGLRSLRYCFTIILLRKTFGVVCGPPVAARKDRRHRARAALDSGRYLRRITRLTKTDH